MDFDKLSKKLLKRESDKQKSKQKFDNRKFLKQQKFEQWYKRYSEIGFEKFAKEIGYTKTNSTLSCHFRKYASSFKPHERFLNNTELV